MIGWFFTLIFLIIAYFIWQRSLAMLRELFYPTEGGRRRGCRPTIMYTFGLLVWFSAGVTASVIALEQFFTRLILALQ